MAQTAKAKPHNLVFLHRDRGYRFGDRDPDMVELCNLIHAEEMSVVAICEKIAAATKGHYRVAPSTITKWLNGTTRRPSNHTLTWVGFALGVRRSWAKIDG